MSEVVKKRGGKREKIEFTDELVQKVANLAAQNNNALDISKEMKLSYPFIRKLMRSPEYQGEVKNALKARLSQFVGLTCKVIEDQLREGNLDAAKIILKTYSLLDPEPMQAQKQETGITVIMPSGVFPQKEEKIVSAEVSEEFEGEAQ